MPMRDDSFLLRPRPLWVLLAGSLSCALAFCLYMFDLGFLAGTSPYWLAPRGLITDSWVDMSTAMSGYYFFVRDVWTWPLFHTTKLAAPDGINIIFTDSIPLVAVLGRIWYRYTGEVVNPFGGWVALSFIGSAVSMTGLVATLGQRGAAAALMATVAGLCMPALMARWGHITLMAHWLIPLAFVVYFSFRLSRRTTGFVGLMLLISALTFLINAYLFVMVAGIFAAALAQATVDKRWGLPQAVFIAVLFASMLVGLAFVSGLVPSKGSVAAWGFGAYSMNVLSPFVPQFSLLLPFLGDRMVDGTGGQYEGFSYLGTGTLVLVVLTLPWLRRAVITTCQAHACLCVLMIGFILFSISNDIYFGGWHIVTIPLPWPILTLAAMFRASGRFVWPALYLLTALAIVAAPACFGRAAGWVLVAVALVQFIDTAPLRSALAARTSVGEPVVLSDKTWAAAIAKHNFLRVIPPFGCYSGPPRFMQHAAMQLQLLASRENVGTNTIYAARHNETCTMPVAFGLAPDELRVYLRTDDTPLPLPGAESGCAAAPDIAVCSRVLDTATLAALIANKP